MKHYCKYCEYETQNKCDYDRHLLTKKTPTKCTTK